MEVRVRQNTVSRYSWRNALGSQIEFNAQVGFVQTLPTTRFNRVEIPIARLNTVPGQGPYGSLFRLRSSGNLDTVMAAGNRVKAGRECGGQEIQVDILTAELTVHGTNCEVESLEPFGVLHEKCGAREFNPGRLGAGLWCQG